MLSGDSYGPVFIYWVSPENVNSTQFLPVPFQLHLQPEVASTIFIMSTTKRSMQPPRNPERSFDTRYNGIFKKTTDLCNMFPDARVLIVISKPGGQPLVFSSEQHGLSWPPAIEEYV